MEQHTNNGRTHYLLTTHEEHVAASGALDAFQHNRSTHFTDDDKLQASELKQRIEQVDNPGIVLTKDDLKFLAGVTRYFLGTSQDASRRRRMNMSPEEVAAAELLRDSYREY